MTNYKLSSKSIKLEVDSLAAAITKLSFNDQEILLPKPPLKKSQHSCTTKTSAIASSSKSAIASSSKSAIASSSKLAIASSSKLAIASSSKSAIASSSKLAIASSSKSAIASSSNLVFTPIADTSAKVVPHFGCFAMVPFANRLRHGKLNVKLSNSLKVDEIFAINLEHEKNSIHGLAWQTEWQLDNTKAKDTISNGINNIQPSKLTFINEQKNLNRTNKKGNYHYLTQLTYKLIDNSLEINLKVRNLSEQTLPYGLGLHPWFCLDETSLVRFSNPLALANYDLYPEASFLKIQNIENIFDPNKYNQLDCCYSNLSKSVEIFNTKHNYKCCYEYKGADFIHVYVNKGQRAFCLEPVTHAPGQLGFAKKDWLTKKQEKSLQLRLSFFWLKL